MTTSNSIRLDIQGQSRESAPRPLPLCVDLDGSLIATDLLWESLLDVLKRNLLCALLLPWWLLHGPARLKMELAARMAFRPASLPYRQELVDFLQAQAGLGRYIVLSTGADARLANAVAEHLGCFNRVLASDGRHNLTGKRKLAALRASFPEGFAYVGDAACDLTIWRQCGEALASGAPDGLCRILRKQWPELQVFPHKPPGLRDYARLVRVHQWSKNGLLLVPAITSHQIFHASTLVPLAWAVVAFCATASFIYIINDLCDLDSDRRHHKKRFRPLASGAVSIPRGLIVAGILLIVGVLAAIQSNLAFASLLTLYAVTASAYSLWLKRILILDTVSLTLLYTLRIMAGAAAIDVVVSTWLLTFALFVFFSLALVKRYSELSALLARNGTEAAGRGYLTTDILQVTCLGAASGMVAVLIFALYASSEAVAVLHHNPDFLLLGCPVLLYWISRIWVLAARGRVQEDPIAFALRDRISVVVLVLMGGIVALATVELPTFL